MRSGRVLSSLLCLRVCGSDWLRGCPPPPNHDVRCLPFLPTSVASRSRSSSSSSGVPAREPAGVLGRELLRKRSRSCAGVRSAEKTGVERPKEDLAPWRRLGR